VGIKWIDTFFYYITYLGDGNISILLLPLIFIYNVRLGIVCTVSFLLSAVTSNVIKYGFYDEVTRPAFVFDWITHTRINRVSDLELHIHNSFPSGHSTQAFAIFMCLSFFAVSNLNKLLFLAIALLTAFSRVYLSQHWLVDITVGSMVGTGSALFFFWLFKVKNRYPNLNVPLFKMSFGRDPGKK
jgi:membrane-associated phospholipid phosphatase